jgi:hypothetical protein
MQFDVIALIYRINTDPIVFAGCGGRTCDTQQRDAGQ